MAHSDAVALTDLEVVQRYSLAVRAATAPREELIEALESDLAWLTGGHPRRPAAGPRAAGAARTSPVAAAPARRRRTAPAPEPAPARRGAKEPTDGT